MRKICFSTGIFLLTILAAGVAVGGSVGALVGRVTPQIAQLIGLDRPRGAFVANVSKGGPADRAGIKVGDIVVEYAGKAIEEADDLPPLVASTPAGAEVQVRVFRENREVVFLVTVEEMGGRRVERGDVSQGAPAGMMYEMGRDRDADRLTTEAVALSQAGEFSEAEVLFREALSIKEKLYGPVHPQVAPILFNLAKLYEMRSQDAQANPLYWRVVAIADNDPWSEQLQQWALDIRKKLLGSNHPDLARSMNNLANFYKSQGKYAQAEPLYLGALAIQEKLWGLSTGRSPLASKAWQSSLATSAGLPRRCHFTTGRWQSRRRPSDQTV